MKKRIAVLAGGAVLLLGIVIYSLVQVAPYLFEQKQEQTFADAPAMKLEYDDSGDIKTLFLTETYAISGLGNFILSLDLEETDEAISDWSYKITFNCKEWVPEGTETIVLVGDNALSIDGTSYTTSEGASFPAVADYIEMKCKYYMENYR